jgi:hypothetical protein
MRTTPVIFFAFLFPFFFITSESDAQSIVSSDKQMESKQCNRQTVSGSKPVTDTKTPVVLSACDDLGVENGWGNWMWQEFDFLTSDSLVFGNPPSLNPHWPKYNITYGNSIDTCTPDTTVPLAPAIPVVAPGFGSHSIKMGASLHVDPIGDQLSCSFNVNASDSVLHYAYAIGQDYALFHAPLELGFAEFIITDQTGDTIPNGYWKITLDTSMAGIFHGTCYNHLYKPWTYDSINLFNYIGQTLTLVLRNAGCAQHGHNSQAYFDFKCSSTSGVDEPGNLLSAVQIYPNPASGMFTVENSNGGITGLEIYNVLGEMIHQSSQRSSKTSVTVDISDMSDGVYFLRIRSGDRFLTKKFVIRN